MMAVDFSSFQDDFHHTWGSLHDPHVRSLAWMLHSPDLLDVSATRWEGRVARLGALADQDDAGWLQTLDSEPSALHQFLSVQPVTRLGRYAEKLLGWYFMQTGHLHAQGMQVRDVSAGTLGEFDFLLRLPQGLEHWELATKFYLLRPHAGSPTDLTPLRRADYFIGPNLADTLGAKMQKIFGRQLSLGQHPAAQALLGEPLLAARALIKGWLFYRRDDVIDDSALGVSAQHCRAWWCSIDEIDSHLAQAAVVLPRLCRLAPAQAAAADVISRSEMRELLRQRLMSNAMPVMIANLVESEGLWRETDRGFVVPSDWQAKAAQRSIDS